MTTQSSVAARFRFWFDAVMIAVYASAGIASLLIPRFLALEDMNRYVIGATLISYAGYRTYKSCLVARRSKSEKE